MVGVTARNKKYIPLVYSNCSIPGSQRASALCHVGKIIELYTVSAIIVSVFFVFKDREFEIVAENCIIHTEILLKIVVFYLFYCSISPFFIKVNNV